MLKDIYGIDSKTQYDGVVLAPSWTAKKIYRGEEVKETPLVKHSTFASYEVEVNGKKLAWIQTGMGASNMVDTALYLAESVVEKIIFVGAVKEVVPDNMKFAEEVLEEAGKQGIEMKKRKVFCTDSIFCEYIHLPEMKETGAELIEMETAGFYECINAMEKKGIALLCVSDNSAADIALVMRDEESTKRYKMAREEYIPKLIDIICEL